MSVYVIPQKNNPNHSIFDGIQNDAVTRIPQRNGPKAVNESTQQMDHMLCDDPNTKQAILALRSHAEKLLKSDRHVDKVKANELSGLFEELSKMSVEEITTRVVSVRPNTPTNLL